MNLIGDLERLFATSLYPLRVPIAIALGLAIAGLVVVARRRGWFAAARRHPRRAGSVVALALVVGLPLTWYLASPLFIRTTLIEPPTAAVADSSPSVPGASIGAPKTTPAPVAFEPVVAASGTFHGVDDFHFGEGTASIIEASPGRFMLRFDAFSVRNGPDLFVYLSPSPDGYADGVLELGTLKATDGSFGYDLPDGIDPTDFASAVIWCKQFAVQFAVAPFDAR